MRYFESVYMTDKELNLHFKKERSAIFTMFIQCSHISVLNDRKPMSNSRSYYSTCWYSIITFITMKGIYILVQPRNVNLCWVHILGRVYFFTWA